MLGRILCTLFLTLCWSIRCHSAMDKVYNAIERSREQKPLEEVSFSSEGSSTVRRTLLVHCRKWNIQIRRQFYLLGKSVNTISFRKSFAERKLDFPKAIMTSATKRNTILTKSKRPKQTLLHFNPCCCDFVASCTFLLTASADSVCYKSLCNFEMFYSMRLNSSLVFRLQITEEKQQNNRKWKFRLATWTSRHVPKLWTRSGVVERMRKRFETTSTNSGSLRVSVDVDMQTRKLTALNNVFRSDNSFAKCHRSVAVMRYTEKTELWFTQKNV